MTSASFQWWPIRGLSAARSPYGSSSRHLGVALRSRSSRAASGFEPLRIAHGGARWRCGASPAAWTEVIFSAGLRRPSETRATIIRRHRGGQQGPPLPDHRHDDRRRHGGDGRDHQRLDGDTVFFCSFSTPSVLAAHLRARHDVVPAVGPPDPRLVPAVVVVAEQDQGRRLAQRGACRRTLGVQPAPDPHEGGWTPARRPPWSDRCGRAGSSCRPAASSSTSMIERLRSS